LFQAAIFGRGRCPSVSGSSRRWSSAFW